MHYINLTPDIAPAGVSVLLSLPNELSDALYSQTSEQSVGRVSTLMDSMNITGFIVDNVNVPPTMHTFLKALSAHRGSSVIYQVFNDGLVVVSN